MTFTIEQTYYETIPMGEYNATITAIVLDDWWYGEQVKFTFQLEDPDFTLWGWVSASFSNKSKLERWAGSAFSEIPLPRDFAFTPEDLIGRKVRLVVSVRQRENGEEFNKVEDVLPLVQENSFEQHRGQEVSPSPDTAPF